MVEHLFVFSPDRASRTPRRKEVERKMQINIEHWLKEKFREGFFSMREQFESKDTEKKGIVSSVFFLYPVEFLIWSFVLMDA